MNTDSSPTFATDSTNVVLSNSYESTTDKTNTTRTIQATDTTLTIVHNGIT